MRRFTPSGSAEHLSGKRSAAPGGYIVNLSRPESDRDRHTVDDNFRPEDKGIMSAHSYPSGSHSY